MDMSQARLAFLEESRELLVQMEQILLRADAGAADAEDVHALFRAAHTIKGSAGMFGLDAIVHFTHDVESVLDRLRNGGAELTPALVSLLLECQDHITALVAAVSGGEAADEAQGQQLSARLLELLHRSAAAPTAPAICGPATCAPDGAEAPAEGAAGELGHAEHWHLSLRFGAGVLRDGMDPLGFIAYLGTLGQIVHVETVTDMLPALADGDPERCWLGFEVALRSDATKAQIESVFEFVTDDATIRIVPPRSRLADYLALIEACTSTSPRLGELLVACGTLTQRELVTALAEQARQADDAKPRLGELLVERGVVAPALVDAALGKQRRAEERRIAESRSVKVPAERLDALIDQVGELVIACATTQLKARGSADRDLQEAADNVLRLVEDVRDTALRMRMTPIGEVFNRFPRVVRDLALELGKEIDLVVRGADAELDKAMIDKIGDPLMHLVRNAIDHGVEPADVRAARGKPARARLELRAYHESGSIVIEVADDGAGLDTGRILAKAVERGMVAPDAQLTPDQIHRLILAPGFSTAAQVTSLSGRGVGMDVVARNVEALRGTLDIASESGAGTLMRLCLPLTLAIIDGFQVSVGAATFIVPLDAVVECIELPAAVADDDARDYLDLRGAVLPFVRLRRTFDVRGSAPPRQSAVVVRCGARLAGIAVDRLHGECQAVIKPLGRLFERISGVAGSSILGTGDVALILDVPQLVQLAVARAGRSGAPTGARAAALA